MVVSQASRFTAKEYLALEAVAETRHEFYGGAIVGMAGAELEDNQIVDNVRAELRNALADRPCRILGSDQRLYVEAKGEYFYPDVLVVCAEPVLVDPKPRSLINPEVIVEVLSDSTERTDRGDKWSAYRAIASLGDYVLVASAQRELDHYHRLPDGNWSLRVVRDAGAVMLANGVVLDVDRLYRLVPGV